MRRTLARLGLLGVLAGTPIALRVLVGAPALPSFRGSNGLFGSYVPIDAVLAILGLLTWAIWAYLVLAVLLHSLAIVTASSNVPGRGAILAASAVLTPKVVRTLVEVAIGSALVTSSITVHASSAFPAVSHSSLARAVSFHPAVIHSDAAPKEPKRETYRVRPGDSLWRIAERELGSGLRWREIYRLNEGRRFSDDRSLNDPYLIYPGWVLKLPDGDRAGTRHGGQAGHEHHADDRPAQAASPSSEPSVEAAPATAESPTPHRQSEGDTQVSGSQGPTVELPSGLLVAASFASGLLTAHLLGKLHRRRSRRLNRVESVEPAPAPDLIRDLKRAGASEMAGPIDVAVDAVIDAWLERAGSWPHIVAAVESAARVWVILADATSELPSSSGGTLSPRIRFVRSGSSLLADVSGPFPPRLRRARTPLERGVLVPLGRAADGSVVHISITGLGQIAAAGTNASDLLAQLLLAAATQGGPGELKLVVLGLVERMGNLCRLPHVTCSGWEEAGFAMREIELELLRRARLFAQEGIDDVRAHLADHSDEQLSAVILVCDEPPAAEIGKIEALGQQAARLGAAVLTLGSGTGGEGLAVRVDQSAELETELPLPAAVQPFLLDASGQKEAIDVILEAHPSEPVGTAEPADEIQSHESPRASVEDLPPARVIAEGVGSTTATEAPHGPALDMMVIRCLGAFEISRGETPIRRGWKAKGRELLAYLVANPSGAPKERIIDELWPEIDPKTAGARFDRYATLVRSLARGTEDSRMYVERVGESSYRLEEGAWWIDAWEFERLNHDAAGCDDAAEATSRFRDALALYRGEFCDDSYYPWLEDVRERYRNLFVESSARLAYLLATAERHDEALLILDRAIRVDPLCEDLIRRAMATEVTMGRRAAALARYRRLETALDEQLGVEPDSETQSMLQHLLHSVSATG